MGVHKSIISRELKRNTGLQGYRPKQAQLLSDNRKAKRAKVRIPVHHWQRVEALIREDWNPEQVSEWLLLNENIQISHEWIYLYVYQDMRQVEAYIHTFAVKKTKEALRQL